MSKNHPIAHPIARAYEHYGVQLTRFDLLDLEAQCACARAPQVMLCRNGERRLVRFGDLAMVAVWRPDLQHIVTFVEMSPNAATAAPPTFADVWPKMRGAAE